MGRHSRKGRSQARNTDTGAVPGISASDPSARGAQAPTAVGRYGPMSGRPPRGSTEGTPTRGVPRFVQGASAGSTRPPADGTHARAMPPAADGTPADDNPQGRGDHPQLREPGGGWGEFRERSVPAGTRPSAPPGRPVPRIPAQRSRPGPRQDYLDAFDEDDDVFAPRRTGGAPLADGRDTEREIEPDYPSVTEVGGAQAKASGKGRTFTGIAAAAVTTALAVVVAGQVADGHGDTAGRSQSAADEDRHTHGSAGSGDGATPSGSPSVTTLTYQQAMGRRYPLSATLKGPGTFTTVPGVDRVSGKGKYRYRVDVEKGLGLDGELFAQAVQRTLNDNRSWAHGERHVFERVSSGEPDFVITLASPGTTAAWCAKSGLDTTVDNVSCDSAATERVVINAYRWAQGSTTYGDEIHAYRQMLINHEVGHRLGHGHVSCDKNGELAPVMQQQTKFLDHDGIHCLPNPWPFPSR
ncbi:DUF3152 domain-containing protein [Streptomyces sp. NPDC001020]